MQIKHKNLRNKGFTLIELVIVIVILGVLAAVAVPKYIDIQRDAKVSVLEGVAGAMESSSAIFQSKAYIEGVKDGPMEYAGNNVQFAGGYLKGHWNDTWRYALEIGKEISFTRQNQECTKHELCGVGNRTNLPGLPIATTGRGLVAIWPEGYTLSDQCYTYYYNPNPENDGIIGEKPTVGVVTSGC